MLMLRHPELHQPMIQHQIHGMLLVQELELHMLLVYILICRQSVQVVCQLQLQILELHIIQVMVNGFKKPILLQQDM